MMGVVWGSWEASGMGCSGEPPRMGAPGMKRGGSQYPGGPDEPPEDGGVPVGSGTWTARGSPASPWDGRLPVGFRG